MNTTHQPIFICCRDEDRRETDLYPGESALRLSPTVVKKQLHKKCKYERPVNTIP